MIFRCGTCNAPLTESLMELTDPTLIKTGDEEPYIPEGYYRRDSPDDWFPGTIVVNLNEVQKFTQLVSARERLNGCCGFDGLDGPNRTCLNGHEVGTEKSDCWMPHVFLMLLTVNAEE